MRTIPQGERTKTICSRCGREDWCQYVNDVLGCFACNLPLIESKNNTTDLHRTKPGDRVIMREEPLKGQRGKILCHRGQDSGFAIVMVLFDQPWAAWYEETRLWQCTEDSLIRDQN